MKILDILNRPWAILDTKLQSMQEVYERYAAGEKFDAEGFKAALGDQGEGSDPGYTVQNGVAIIPIEGVIAKRMNLFTWFSGGMSTQILQQTLDAVAKDPAVHSAITTIDSPGGEVDGTQLAAVAIAELNKTKPVVAFIDGLAASAAYWLASQASQIYIADLTTVVGSIGVVTAHTDRSKANEMSGRVVTEITAGKYKRIASTHAPLSLEGRQTIQDQLDQVYSVFVDAVAAGRGVSADTVLSDMADGKIFIGQQAIDAGLVDGVSSIPAIIAQLNADFQQQQQDPGSRPANSNHGAKSMFKTFATEADYNAAMSAEFARGAASVSTLSDADLTRIKGEASVAGATAERERIQAVEGQMLAGHGELIKTLKYDGKTTGPEAAVAILAAEKKVRKDKGDALAEDAPNPVQASAADPQAEAAAAREAAAAASTGTSEQDPRAMSAKIDAHVVAEAAKGRKISVAQAAEEIFTK